MAFHLADFRGDAIYLHTNVLVRLVDAHSVYHAACAAFFQRAVEPARPLQLFTASLTLDEVLFVLLQELIVRAPYRITRNRSRYLHDHPEVVRNLMTQLDPLNQSHEMPTLDVPDTPILHACACYQCANVVWLDLDAGVLAKPRM